MVMILGFGMGFPLMVIRSDSSSWESLVVTGRLVRLSSRNFGSSILCCNNHGDSANVNDGSFVLMTPLRGTVATNNCEVHALAATVGWQTRNEAHQFRRSIPTAWATVLSQTQVEVLFLLDYLGTWGSPPE